MDLTEFKLLEENKQLIQDSLKREEDLNKEIQRLKDNHIKELQKNEDKILVETIINTREERLRHVNNVELKWLIDRERIVGIDELISYIVKELQNKDTTTHSRTSVSFIGMEDAKKKIEADTEERFKSKIESLEASVEYYKDEHNSKVTRLEETIREINKEREEELIELKDKLNIDLDKERQALESLEHTFNKIKKLIKSLKWYNVKSFKRAIKVY